jgi:peptidyl-prolyl cis-trans isomerase B (cyclophilin B)
MKAFTIITAAIFAMNIFMASCGNASSSNNSQKKQAEMPDQTKAQGTMVKIITEFGDITLLLYNETPLHRDNFLKLTGEGYYDGVLFHRVINAFMIQGGDPNSKTAQPGQPLGTGGPDYTIAAEVVTGLFHKKGALAAARLGDQQNPQRRSSGSQFYIVQGRVWTPEELDRMEQQRGQAFSPEQRQAYTTIGGTPHLDAAYTVFGEVVEGLEVVDRIAAVQTGPGDRPLQDISMKIIVLK